MDSEAVFVDPIVIARAMMQISTPALRLSLAKEVYPAGGQSRSRFWVTKQNVGAFAVPPVEKQPLIRR